MPARLEGQRSSVWLEEKSGLGEEESERKLTMGLKQFDFSEMGIHQKFLREM